MKESKRNEEEKNEKAITKYNNPKRNKKTEVIFQILIDHCFLIF